MPDAGVGPEDFADLVPALRRHLIRPRIRILRHLETEDSLWALVRVEAESAIDLAPIRFDGQVMICVRNGRIVEAHNHFDFLSLFETLGFLPRDTFLLCLSGERIA